MSIVVKGRGFPLDVEALSDGVLRFSLDGSVIGAITSAGVLSATTLSATALTWGSGSADTMTATTVTATTISGTNVLATTVTATTLSAASSKNTTVTATTFSGVDVLATQVTATTLCGQTGSTGFVFTAGGSATNGAQVLTAHAFLTITKGAATAYLPAFSAVTPSA